VPDSTAIALREAAARGVKFVSPAPREKETACALREEPPKQK
jgi:hypothetical protein